MQSHEPAAQKKCGCNVTANVIALPLQNFVKCTGMHCVLLSAVTVDAGLEKQFAFSSCAASGQSTLLGMCLSGNAVKVRLLTAVC
jgi:hypothetical protein